ncbi:MAG: hypothetical protein KZQ91_08115 [Candidatus Thiodiazotropha sp. (ex Lucinoma borealis)]|nr:hypothetical protein [Candidatus Thiodiazotropha sp. (ex Lucinoma borealis)]
MWLQASAVEGCPVVKQNGRYSVFGLGSCKVQLVAGRDFLDSHTQEDSQEEVEAHTGSCRNRHDIG